MKPAVVFNALHLLNLFLFVCILPAIQACRGCSPNPLDAKVLKDIRIEAIKQKILEKLRLTKAPMVTKPKRPVPKMLLNEVFMYNDGREFSGEDQEEVNRMDDFYAKESQMVIFADTGSSRCGQAKGNTACLTFTLPPLFFKKNIQSAAVHFHVRSSHPKQVFTLKDRNVEPENIILNFNLEAKSREGWQPIDITSTAKKWSQTPGGNMRATVIQLSCEECHPESIHRYVTLDGDQVPYLVVQTDKRNDRRNRRGLECHPGVDSCCRESLFVNFTDIGWDSWIIEPKGYSANYCRGQCNAGVQMPTHHHSAVVQMAKQSHLQNTIHGHRETFHAKTLSNEIVTCCAPTRMASITLLFFDSDGIVHKTILPNMSVDSCGCS